jgi:hypothetical protein
MMKARIGLDGCRKVGWLRLFYAAIVIADQLLLGLDVNFFFSPKDGVSPITIDREKSGIDPKYQYSLLQLFPESEGWLWIVYGLGLVHAVCLLLGVAPRFNAVALSINLRSFHNVSTLIFDGEDAMMDIFGFFLFFLPLHHITIYDGFGAKPQISTTRSAVDASSPKSQELSDEKDQQLLRQNTWPMWPIWLWKWQIMII